jgi:hypothetical protein
MPLHSNQHAYHAGKSMDIALHQQIVWAEKATDQQVAALGIFLDTQGAFTYTTLDSVCDALARRVWPHHCPVD